MPLTDRLTTIALNSSAVVNSGATEKVGNEIDILGPTRDIALGTPLYFLIQVQTAFVGSGASFELKLVSSASTDLTTPTEHWTSGVLALSDGYGAAGTRWQPSIDHGHFLRYVGLTITGSGANITAGGLDAMLQLHRFKWTTYPEGIN
jgi:hypothetical protein